LYIYFWKESEDFENYNPPCLFIMNMPRIGIDQDIYESVEQRVDEFEFESVEEYTEYVLKFVVSENPALSDQTADSDSDQEAARENLKSLGYLE